MDNFLVVYEVRDRKEWQIVAAKNTMHAKQIIKNENSSNMLNFIDVDFVESDNLVNDDD